MGEYADDAIHEGLDQSWGFRRKPRPHNVVCRHCGAQWLHWAEYSDGWELQEFDGKFYIKHACKMKGRFKGRRLANKNHLEVDWGHELDDEVPF